MAPSITTFCRQIFKVVDANNPPSLQEEFQNEVRLSEVVGMQSSFRGQVGGQVVHPLVPLYCLYS